MKWRRGEACFVMYYSGGYSVSFSTSPATVATLHRDGDVTVRMDCGRRLRTTPAYLRRTGGEISGAALAARGVNAWS